MGSNDISIKLAVFNRGFGFIQQLHLTGYYVSYIFKERERERERCGGKSLNCPSWTRAVWGIGNGYIFQFHLGTVQTIYIVCCVFTHKSIYLDAQHRLLFLMYLCTALNMIELNFVESLSSPRSSTSMLQYCVID